jgi:tetratricopeptide (TPR) repeat protein
MKRRWTAIGLLLLLGSGAIWWRQREPRATPAPDRTPVEQRLLDAVARQPDSAAAHRALGEYYLQERQPFSAIWELEQARALDPQHSDTSVQIATALALANLHPAAEEQLAAVVAARPPVRTGRRELAALFLWTARPERALAVLQAVPDLNDWPEGQLLLGRTHQALGRVADMRRAYERFTQLAPTSPEGPYRLAYFLLTNRNPQAARAVLTGALRTHPEDARLLQLLAMTYSARWGDAEQPERQNELLTRAMRISDASVGVRLALAELHLSQRRFQEGGRLLAPLAERQDLASAHRGMAVALAGLGQTTEAQYHRGMAAVVEGQADQALPAFRALATEAPRDVRGLQLLSQTYAQMNQLHQALQAAQSLYRGGDRSPDLYARLATLTLLTHDRRAARRIGEEWHASQPESGRPLAHLGKVALADLQLAEAIEYYAQAVAREPKNAEFRVSLADALSRRPTPENTRRALSLLREAVALAPDDPAPRYQLGVRLQQAGHIEEARQQLLHALDGDPTQAAAYNNLLQVAAVLRQPLLARRFESLMRLVRESRRTRDAAWRRRWEHPTDPDAYYQLALDLTRTGGLSSAEYQLQRALTLRPHWPEASRLLDRVRRLLDGMDTDGVRLVPLSAAEPVATARRVARGQG